MSATFYISQTVSLVTITLSYSITLHGILLFFVTRSLNVAKHMTEATACKNTLPILYTITIGGTPTITAFNDYLLHTSSSQGFIVLIK